MDLLITTCFPIVKWQVNAAAEVIYDLVDPSANLIFGAVVDPSLSGQVSSSIQYYYNLEIWDLCCQLPPPFTLYLTNDEEFFIRK